MVKSMGNPRAITWVGHGTVLLVSAQGTRVVVDPWLEGNPAAPAHVTIEGLGDVGLVAVTHGHSDHIGSLADVARAGCKVVCTSEMAAYCRLLGISNVYEMNKGGTMRFRDVDVTMVSADHSSGIAAGSGEPDMYGGEAVGYVFSFPEDDTAPVYVAGDTNVFGDMALIRDLYGPELGLLPIDGNYNMGPREAAHASRLLGLKRVVPIHYGTFPTLRGSPEELRAELARSGGSASCVIVAPGDDVSLGKKGE